MNRRKSVVIVSSYVDAAIKEQQPDVKFILFRSLQELSSYIDMTPIRADVVYVTKEVFQPSVNMSLDFFASMLKNPFLSVDKVEYITDTGSKEIESVKYLIDTLELSNWRIVSGSVTREFVSGIVSGTLRSDDISPVRKAIFRQRKSDYVAERLKNKTSLDQKYSSDEEQLSDIPDEPVIPINPIYVDTTCRIVTVAGLPLQERSVFGFILAQYLAHSGKTVIIEKDFEYLTMSDIAMKSGATMMRIDIEDLYTNTKDALRYIRESSVNLVVIVSTRRKDYNYSFICNMLYNNLEDKIEYLVVESGMEEITASKEYITVLPNNLIDVIKTVELLPDNFQDNSSFVGVNMRTLRETGIINTDALSVILQDLLQVANRIDVPIVNIRSLKLGGEAHDLGVLIKSNGK